jgi:hypothetical protein
MMQIPKHYKGREQAYFKHGLLKAYLERLFMIVGQHHKTICYVDCFAGPWQEKGADLEDTSIAISLKIIRKCRDGLKKLGRGLTLIISMPCSSVLLFSTKHRGRQPDLREGAGLIQSYFAVCGFQVP